MPESKHLTPLVMLGLVVLGSSALTGSAQTSQVPFVNQPTVPETVAPGGAGFTLTVNGTGFLSGSIVNWNATPLATTFVSGSQLTASVPAGNAGTPQTASVTVVNPGPGGGTSNPQMVQVDALQPLPLLFNGTSYAAAAIPFFVVAADFNGDGKQDLAVANIVANTVSIFLGNGDGTFQPRVDYATAVGPSGLAVGDFNGDGKLDLAVAANNCAEPPCANGLVSVLLGNGDGTFGPHVDYSTAGIFPHSVATADFNGDGKLDLAAVNSCGSDPSCNNQSGVLAVLLGNGDGTFQAPKTFGTGFDPVAVASGDFNGDGKLDLAAVNYVDSTVSILLGNGDGTFQTHVDYVTGPNPNGITVADFSGDAKLDLAIPNSARTVAILAGNGDGTFSPAGELATDNFNASSATTGDFNGDGNLDLAVATGGSVVSILLGDGHLNFQPAINYPVGPCSFSVAAGDFNGDGKLDLVTANDDSTLSVLVQTVNPVATLSPASLTFGTQLVGTVSGKQNTTLSNTGNAALSITSVAVSGNFVESNACGASVPPGASCAITAQFKPTQKGTRTGAVSIADNAPGSPQAVSLTGTATLVKLSPTSLNFGAVPVGTTSSAMTVTFTNAASVGTVNIGSIKFSGFNTGAFAQTNTCGTSVPPRGSCTFSITFTPKAKGRETATLNIFDNGGASPQTVALSGSGT
ncbi:MAG TPA: FG-GAP-like repeat-containing protein [Terriglobia bacterium]|nr:FG-GAP-like repeat-containing protein [Terriglobia bacterium]